MRIAVTGSSGFLGTALCASLAARGDTVVGLHTANCDLTRDGALESAADGRFDQVFHLAAWTQAGDFCLHHPGEQWIINQQINTNVLAWWQRRQPQAKLVFMGTSCAYAPGSGHREPEYMLGEPIAALHTYAMTKRMLFEGARALSQQFGLHFLCAVPSTLYGPGYHTDGRQMHFIFDLMRKIIRGREYGEPVVLWGTGEQKRELVYIDDFIRVLLEIAPNIDNELINVGAGVEHSIRDFAAAICRIVGFPDRDIQYDTTRYVGATTKLLDIEKLRAALPGYSTVSLEEGLHNCIQWFYASRAYGPPTSRHTGL